MVGPNLIAEESMPNSITVSLAEVQGIILRGYELLHAARFALLKIEDVKDARAWLATIANRLTSAAKKPTENGINLAFTIAGLEKLGLPKETRQQFLTEFQEGIDSEHRRRVLGDTDCLEHDLVDFEKQSPGYWRWGNRDEDKTNPDRAKEQVLAKDMHMLLMVYAADETLLETLFEHLQSEFRGLSVIQKFDTHFSKDRKEHFGFRDGIAQPAVEGVLKEDPRTEVEPKIPSNMIKTGEFLLGYPNQYEKFPSSPTVPNRHSGEMLDFGRNGSYLVFRQLQQDVPGFWKYIFEATRSSGSPADHFRACVRLAAKMVGRWPSGAPLSKDPESEPIDQDPKTIDNDDYLFEEDPLGLNTPIGSHTRRSNPRDSIEPGPDGKERLSAEVSLQVTKLHRIIRRGRPYGPPVVSSMDPKDILRALADPKALADAIRSERGLLFLCFNANIARQFEFIQQTWINNPKFGGLYRDGDPIMGQRHPGELNEPADVFTVQAKPVRQRFTGLKPFVRVRGGGYFFMPSIEAVKYLAHVPCRLEMAFPATT